MILLWSVQGRHWPGMLHSDTKVTDWLGWVTWHMHCRMTNSVSLLSCMTSGSTLRWAVWPLGPLFAELCDLWVHSSLSCMTSGSTLRWAVWPLGPLFAELYDLWVHSSLSCMTSGSTLHWAVWPLGPLFAELCDLWVDSARASAMKNSTASSSSLQFSLAHITGLGRAPPLELGRLRICLWI